MVIKLNDDDKTIVNLSKLCAIRMIHNYGLYDGSFYIGFEMFIGFQKITCFYRDSNKETHSTKILTTHDAEGLKNISSKQNWDRFIKDYQMIEDYIWEKL